jgi:hypothetical protein
VAISVSGPTANISRRAEDAQPQSDQADGRRKEKDMLFGVPPATRAVIGVALLIIGLLLHLMLLEAAGAAAIVISACLWMSRRGGAAR